MTGQSQRKQLVKVIAAHDIDGSIRPLKILLTGGESFDVQEAKRVNKVEIHCPFEFVNRYTVVVKGQETYLFKMAGKWFVMIRA